jgi:hypothetical protein
MLIFWQTGVQCTNCPVHFGAGIDGIGHSLETRQQTVAKAFHEDAPMTRQYFGGDDTDELCPSANGERLVLSHEAHGFHEVNQQYDGFLPHESDARAPNAVSLGLSGLLLAFVQRIIVHGDPTARSRPCHPRWYGTASQELGRQGDGMVIRPPTPALDEHVGVRGLLVRAGAMAVTANIGHENGWWPRHEGFAGQEYSRDR